uniref:Uncharacterized protein n=1 Tax=Cyprinus carpio TaxID=7962 RepID=A0A8C2BZ29_CYPCA
SPISFQYTASLTYTGSKAAEAPSASKTLIWGPGFETNIVLPARFCFIQTMDTTGRNVHLAEKYRLWVQTLGNITILIIRYHHASPVDKSQYIK